MSFRLDALQGQGLPARPEPSPLGASGGPRLPRCLPHMWAAASSPPLHRPLGSLQTINSGLGSLTFPGMLSRVPGVHPQKGRMAFGSTGLWGRQLQSPPTPPPPKLSWEPWSRLVRLQGRSAPSHAGSAPLCAGPYGSSHRPFLDSQPPPSVAPHSAGEDIEGQKDQASRAGFQLCPLPPRLQTGMGTPLP